MSKKLIAVAAAFALGATALVALPANASALSIEVNGLVTAPNTAKTAETHSAPETGEVIYDDGTYNDTAIEFYVSGENKQTVSVSTTGGVKLVEDYLDEDDNYVTIDTGKSSLGATLATASGNDYTFYAYTTSTTPGTVVITSAGNTSVYYIAATPGTAYNVSAVFPSSVPVSADKGAMVYATITDVFGNVINDDNNYDWTVFDDYAFESDPDESNNYLEMTTVGTDYDYLDDWDWNSTKKAWENETELYASVTGPVAIRLELPDAEDLDAGFAAPKNIAISSISAQSLEEQVKSLTAQVAALTAQVAARVSKKRFNKLARKWNAAFPAQKVALKK